MLTAIFEENTLVTRFEIKESDTAGINSYEHSIIADETALAGTF